MEVESEFPLRMLGLSSPNLRRFGWGGPIGEPRLLECMKCTTKASALTSLELSSHLRSIPTNLGYILAQTLTAFTNLEILRLDFHCNPVMEEANIFMVCQACTQLPHLRILALNFSANHLLEIGESIEVLAGAKHLEDLWISLAHNLMGSLSPALRMVNALANLPVTLTRLNKFRIDVSDCEMGFMVKELKNQLKRLPPNLSNRCLVTLVY